MQRTTPPFRADHVGSLLRPAPLKAARERRERGEIDDAALKAVEDREILAVMRRQAEIGLKSITDGEFRRSMWHFDFLERLDGVESYAAAQGIQFKGVQTKAKGLKVTGKIGFTGHPMLDHFRFVAANAPAGTTAKMTIPSPSVLHFRGGRKAVGEYVYPDMDGFFADLGDAYRKAVKAFGDAGCRYLQLDETNLAYLCDPAQREMLKARGDDPDTLPATYAKLINTAIADRPTDAPTSNAIPSPKATSTKRRTIESANFMCHP